MQLLDALYKRDGFVEGIIAAFRGAGMTAPPLKDDADLGAPSVAPVNLHVSRFAYDDKIGANALVLNQGITGDAVTPFFHVAKIIERPISRQSELLHGGHGIDHRR